MLFNTIKRHTTIKNISSENILSFSYGSTNDFPEKFYTFADVCKTNEKSTRQTDILKRRYQRIIFNLWTSHIQTTNEDSAHGNAHKCMYTHVRQAFAARARWRKPYRRALAHIALTWVIRFANLLVGQCEGLKIGCARSESHVYYYAYTRTNNNEGLGGSALTDLQANTTTWFISATR